MKRLAGQRPTSITHFFIYVLAFLLLWEWLRPIPTVSNTGHIDVFIWFAFFSSALIYLRIPIKFIVPCLFLGMLYGLNYIFSRESFFSREGGLETFRLFMSESIYNISLIYMWDLASLTNFFRTLLLFLLLALICYLLYFWIFHTRKIFFFLLSTIIYITVLDTFTAIDASMAIIRIVVIGFFMMTLLHMLKVQEEEKAIKRIKGTYISTAWMYTLIFMILIATSIGYAAPKFDPQWDDPVPTFQRYVLGEGHGSGSVNRVGYGENDELLGGGFIQDHSTVFFAVAEEAAYWRGDSKHEYTGRGWIGEPRLVESESSYVENAIDYYMYRNSVHVEEREVLITMADGVGFNHLFYPGQLTDVDRSLLSFEPIGSSEDNDLPFTFLTDVNGGKISADDNTIVFKEYGLTYDYPKFSLNQLRDSSEDDPDSIRDLYLQLPEDLPERVSNLAEEITSDYDNRYDQVIAVEQYFSRNGYEYRTTDVPTPVEGQDYVDQFLFETQYGYCDNYSTAMAVLLRAVDIPTRWVKGFTAGEELEEVGEGHRYEVKNSNAHSWVEVYFPDVGWVPFEPTQGFTNNVEFYEEEEETVTDIESSEEDRDEQETPEREDLMPLWEEENEDFEPGAASGSGRNTKSGIEWLTTKNVIISIVVLLMVMIFYQKQNRIQNRYFLMKYRILGKDEKFLSAYDRLLWILKNEGLPRGEGETLREYATRVDRVLNSMSMAKLTKTYERMYYGGKEFNGEWEKQRKDWEELVKALNP
ncbi:DUF4129 domain-containing transglutaminase family protein [Evansella tamaricis]|uniref:Transglutaminase domain-containing protein n=1 Tax=Evansella tamaricis TaxID=2069301 RepID=A0ABS6JAI3_9BACI|nr:transglutaminase domain-containing protein [Evansella tamaricis]MBU9710686.1 transglutaminase domain-containing protein [Evansella tamaricis]